MEEQKINSASKSYLSFSLAGELFAMEVGYIIKIIEVNKFTKVPQAPPYFKGVTNFGGGVLPVVDTRLKFGFPADQTMTNQLVLVIDVRLGNDDSDSRLGMTIDEAREVFEAENDELKAYPLTGNKYKADYVAGVVERNEQFVMILDAGRIFSENELDELISTN
jgi:purine-binding chemotaxis protein CheW